MARKGMWRNHYAPLCHIFYGNWGLRFLHRHFPFLYKFPMVCWHLYAVLERGKVLVFWKDEGSGLMHALTTALTIGLLFGIVMAVIQLLVKKVDHLPEWKQV